MINIPEAKSVWLQSAETAFRRAFPLPEERL